MSDPTGPEDDGTESKKIGEATVRRYIDHENDALVTIGDFAPFFAAYLDHVRRWESEPDGLSSTLMRQGLGAAILHLSTRPFGESVGWTIHVHDPPTNLFLTGDAAEGTVTGRVYTEDVKPSEQSRIYVQISRQGREPTQSVVEVEGLDVLEMFDRYYERSEQMPARFFEITEEQYIMVLALPDADPDWIRNLDREAALALLSRGLKPLGESTYRFQCGCTSERMLEVVGGLFATKPNELFRGEDGVEVFCPRCGRRWWVDRETFDETLAAASDAEADARADDSERAEG